MFIFDEASSEHKQDSQHCGSNRKTLELKGGKERIHNTLLYRSGVLCSMPTRPHIGQGKDSHPLISSKETQLGLAFSQ